MFVSSKNSNAALPPQEENECSVKANGCIEAPETIPTKEGSRITITPYRTAIVAVITAIAGQITGIQYLVYAAMLTAIVCLVIDAAITLKREGLHVRVARQNGQRPRQSAHV